MSGIVGQNAGRDSGVVGAVDSTVSDNAIDETKLKDALVADFTEVVVAAGDSILLGDVSASGVTKRDTVQGILDLVPASGKVLQVVTVHKTDVFSTTSTTIADVTGLTVSIAPASTSSKVLVLYSVTCGSATGGAYGGIIKLLRGSTVINQGDAANSNSRAAGGMYTDSYNYQTFVIAGCFLDSPSTTDSTAYKFQAFTANAGTAFYINRPGYAGSAVAIGRFPSTITLLEIAG
tara:strand:+ start:126 stop:827 length:702 start_codon:yes stop_codon:yes gene_type:complete